MAVTSKPTAKKTTINFSNFAGRGGSNASQPTNQFADIGRSASNNIQQIDNTIALEQHTDALDRRIQNQQNFLQTLSGRLDGQIAVINERINFLQSGQKAIIDNAKDKSKDDAKQRKLEEQKLKRKSAEASLEEGGEKKDVDAQDNKSKDSAKKSMGILDRLKQFLTFVVAGWFTDKTFKLIEAFQSGNQKQIRQIGLKLLAGAAAVGSIMLLAAGAIGPVLAGIGSLIGVLAGLLFNPVTLTALLIAVGVGGAIMGIRALWKWGRKKALGGEGFRDKHNELDQQLVDAGMDKDGKVKNEEGKWVRTTDPEQLKILEKVEAEREQLKELKKTMKSDVEDSKKAYFDEVRAGEPKGWGKRKERKEYWDKARKEWAEKEKGMYADYNKQALNIGGVKGDGSNVGSTASGSTAADGIGPAETTEGNVTVIPKFTEKTDTIQKGRIKGVEPLTSGNSDNRYLLDAKLTYNTFV